MKILIINPPRVMGLPVVREERYEHKDFGAIYPPLNLLYTASNLRKNKFDVILIDANGFDISFNKLANKIDEIKPEIIISRCGFDTQDEDLRILKYAKDKFKSITIVRNKIISDVPWLKKEFLEKNRFIDIFVNHELDFSIVDIVNHIVKVRNQDFYNELSKIDGISFIKDNEVISTKASDFSKIDIDEMPFPAYDLLPDLSPYHTGVSHFPFALIVTSRGCPFQCSFCAYSRMGYKIRKPEKIIEEFIWLKEKFALKSFLFFDDLLGLNKEAFTKLLNLMIENKLNLKWVGCTRANLLDDELVKLMKKAGCEEMAIGIESGSEKVLSITKKGISLSDIRKAAKILHKNKILFYGLAIIGLPGETKETINETIEFIKEIDPFYTQFCFATPFPNTEIYKYYKDKGLLLTEDWNKYFPLSAEPVIRTEALTEEELKYLRNYAYRKLILRPGYLIRKIRLFDWEWNIKGFIKILERISAIIRKKTIR
ncbi:MAG: radical SAM protein [Candidatus Firestonebacteria bacterium]|nr:radical SAM protein [Candidatus Firestonebacteria bacterium]